jgi:hypothetical protein
MAGGYHPTGAFDEANDMMANDPELFKSSTRNVVVILMQLINTPPKELISLIMEMLFTRSVESRCYNYG